MAVDPNVGCEVGGRVGGIGSARTMFGHGGVVNSDLAGQCAAYAGFGGGMSGRAIRPYRSGWTSRSQFAAQG